MELESEKIDVLHVKVQRKSSRTRKLTVKASEQVKKAKRPISRKNHKQYQDSKSNIRLQPRLMFSGSASNAMSTLMIQPKSTFSGRISQAISQSQSTFSGHLSQTASHSQSKATNNFKRIVQSQPSASQASENDVLMNADPDPSDSMIQPKSTFSGRISQAISQSQSTFSGHLSQTASHSQSKATNNFKRIVQSQPSASQASKNDVLISTPKSAQHTDQASLFHAADIDPVVDEWQNIFNEALPTSDSILNKSDKPLNYTSDDTPPIITKPQKRKRTNKNWIIVDDYPTYEAALNEIKAQQTWSICSKSEFVTLFRCNKVKKGNEQCQSVSLRLHDKDLGVTLYTSQNPHNCDQLPKATAKLTPDVEQFIKKCYAKGLKRKGIEDEFIKARMPLPARYVLVNFIAKLRQLDTQRVTLTMSDLNNILIEHTTIPNDEFTAYVLDYQIRDDDDIRFNFVVSCKKLLDLNLQSPVCNADTTYKLIWQGYPVQITGHTDYNKKFHPSSVSVSSNEDEEDFAFIFESLKKGTYKALHQEWKPLILIADTGNVHHLIYAKR